MSIYILVLLITLAIGSAGYITRKMFYHMKRRAARARFRDYIQVLIGVNPRHNRRVMYETAPLKQQELSWLVAQNRESIQKGLKAYAEAQNVDNRSHYLNTFGIRHSAHQHRRLITRALSVIRGGFRTGRKALTYSLRKFLEYVKVRLRSIPRYAVQSIQLMRNIIRVGFGGEQDGEVDSVHKDPPRGNNQGS